MRIALDLDGTLVSCRERHVALLLSLSRAMSIAIDGEEFWRHKRMGKSTLATLIDLGVEPGRASCLNDTWVAEVENYPWLSLDRVLSGIPGELTRVRDRGHSLHLVSARRNAGHAWHQLRCLNLDRYFSTVHFVSPGQFDGKVSILRALRADLYVGDTERDCNDSSGAGVFFRAVQTGMRSAEYLQGATGVQACDSLLVALAPF